jgi:hypothetical protein
MDDLSHLPEWLDTFELMRARGVVLLDAFSTRIAADFRSDAPGDAYSSPKRRTAFFGRLISGFRVLRRAWVQHRLLRREYAGDNPPSTAVVALTSRRLPLPPDQSPRDRLTTLARAMPVASDCGRVARAITDADVILLCEPFKTALWDAPERFWREKVFLVDYGFVGLILLLSPLRTVRALVSQRSALRAEWRQGRQRFRNALVGLLLTVGYQRLFAGIASPQAYFFTSNSFASEVLRVTLLRTAQCEKVCELLHGIPTEEFEEYLESVLVFADDRRKHTFVPQLPAFPAYGVVAAALDGEPNFAVNMAVNRYFSDHRSSLRDVARWIERECAPLTARNAAAGVSVLTVIGATGTERDYLSSRAFQAELTILRRAVTVLADADRPFVVCYAPHPAHTAAMFESIPFFKENRVAICMDTVLMWLVSDACIGLYSSALFEAAYLGISVFTPLRCDDGLFRQAVLDRVSHPRGGESWLAALETFLQESKQLPVERLAARAERRMQLLTDVSASRGGVRA